MMKNTKPKAVQASLQPRAPPLDMSSVATKAKAENTTSDGSSRIFGLQDAPCYYPSTEEFMEPLKFIESIRPEAEKAGICKIIPPEGWKPTFALDTEVFRFKTRIQKLNSMEGETRTNLNYLDQLYKFHRQQGNPVLKIPQLDKRPIDLFRLRKEVAARGGYQKVTSGKKWAEIGRGLDYTRKQCTSLSNALKSAYVKVILPYEIYLSKQGKNGNDNQSTELKREYSQDLSTNGSTESSQDHTPTPAAPETRKSKRIKKDPVSYADSEPSSPSQSDRMSSEPLSAKKDDNDEDSDVCEICHADTDLDKMLICDGCELGYHMYCLTPPLLQIPKTDWYCAKCLLAGDDFGFEEGEEYSLSSFQQKCNNFKKNWFEKSGYKDGRVSEDVVEREFWRLVENAYETAEVEYGADLHSTQHGSGFPSIERNPNDKYSTHPANLNNIPILPESLFSHIKTDISGMMVPWLYVGMCFSTFCWHNEDHYTYSINYLHWGDTKTWYGVPASDALKFEDTMKKAVPGLFEQQPDLLFQLVTMLSPERLVANDVKVLALDQRPGQFVVTFPQAYHAGFNHGFNFAEAVNFAPPDWCQFGLECVQRYKDYRKHPVFSHDELIMTTLLDDNSIATAYWLQDEMKRLLDRELSDRKDALKQLPKLKVILEEEDKPEEEVQCSFCNCYIYLSQIGCKCTSKVVCHDHINELCRCEVGDRFLRLRYSEEQLKKYAEDINGIASIPGLWIEKYKKTMMETRVPSLKLLKSLLAEADRIPFPIKEATRLRKFVAVANEWVEAATKVLIRKHHQGRRLLERSQGSGGKRLEDLQEMLRQVERLRFDCPEIRQLEESIEIIAEFQMDAQNALTRTEHDLAECRELYEAGMGMNITMDEIDQLETIVTDLTWIERASSRGALQEDYLLICSLVDDAKRSGVSASNPLLIQLIEKQGTGQDWEVKAHQVLNTNPVNLDKLQEIIESGKSLPVPKSILQKAEQLYNKAQEWRKTVDHLTKKSGEISYEDRPPVSDLKRALKIADSTPIKTEHKEMFDEESRKFSEWMASCQELLLPPGSKKFVSIELREALEDLRQNVEATTAEEPLPLPTTSANPGKGPESNNTVNTDAAEALDKDVPTLDKTNPSTQPETQGSIVTENDVKKADDRQVTDSSTVKLQESEESSNPAAPGDNEKDEQIYCLCRSTESGMMVECDECHEWYHGPCVRVTKREASIKSNYICPVCNLSLVIRRDKARPLFDQVKKCAKDAESLRFFTPEVPLLALIVEKVTKFRERVQNFLNQKPIEEKDILRVKAFLRKVEGLDVALPIEREALRTHVLRLCPSSMPIPGVTLSTYPSAPPLSNINSQCYCSPQHYTPEEVKLYPPEDNVMIQCALCGEWQHTSCVGLDLERVQKLSRFVCPVCCVVRKKLYAFGPIQYSIEVQARAAVRNQANKEANDAKKKKPKPQIDPLTGLERKKRPYKRREQTEGEKIKPKRRKSSGTSTVSTDSNIITFQVGNTGNSGPVSPVTTLPSFSEGFLLPHEKIAPLKHQQHSPTQSHQRTPSHSMPLYQSNHTSPHGPSQYHPPPRQSSPQHQLRYDHPPGGSYRSYPPGPLEHQQRSPMQAHSHPHSHSHHSHSPIQSSAHSHSHPHPHRHGYSHSSPPPPSHLHPHASPPLRNEHTSPRSYNNQYYGTSAQGHYPPPHPNHHHHSPHSHHQKHQHPNQRIVESYHNSDMSHLHRDDHGHYPHYPPPRSYAGYNNNTHNQSSNATPNLPPLMNHQNSHKQSHGHYLPPQGSKSNPAKSPKNTDNRIEGVRMADVGNNGDNETNDIGRS